MLQHHKGKVGVPYSIKITKIMIIKQNKTKTKTNKQTKNQLTFCVLDAELDYFEDFELKKKRFWANKGGPFPVI